MRCLYLDTSAVLEAYAWCAFVLFILQWLVSVSDLLTGSHQKILEALKDCVSAVKNTSLSFCKLASRGSITRPLINAARKERKLQCVLHQMSAHSILRVIMHKNNKWNQLYCRVFDFTDMTKMIIIATDAVSIFYSNFSYSQDFSSYSLCFDEQYFLMSLFILLMVLSLKWQF